MKLNFFIISLLLLFSTCYAEVDDRLAVVFSSTAINGDTAPHIKGYFIYINKGVEYKEDIQFRGLGSKNLRGSSIEKVYVRKVSGTGSYRITVVEGGKIIFQTEMSRDELPIIYVKP